MLEELEGDDLLRRIVYDRGLKEGHDALDDLLRRAKKEAEMAQTFNITKPAMQTMTTEQCGALARLMTDRVAGISVAKGALDLPEGYVEFQQRYEEGVIIYGGIAPNGDVST